MLPGVLASQSQNDVIPGAPSKDAGRETTLGLFVAKYATGYPDTAHGTMRPDSALPANPKRPARRSPGPGGHAYSRTRYDAPTPRWADTRRQCASWLC